MKKIKKVAFLVLFLTICLLGSVNTFAAVEAKINGKSYGTLEKAIAAVKTGQTIVLTKDIDRRKSVIVSRSVSFTLDMAGHRLKAVGKGPERGDGSSVFKGILHVAAGHVTLLRGIIGGNSSWTSLTVAKGARVTVKSGSYCTMASWGRLALGKVSFVPQRSREAVVNYRQGYTTLNGTKVKTTSADSVVCHGGNIKILSATIRTNQGNGVSYDRGGRVQILNADIYCKGTGGNCDSVSGKNGTAVISSGTYRGIFSLRNGEDSTMTVLGGTFPNSVMVKTKSLLTIKGGTFTSSGCVIMGSGEGSRVTIEGGTIRSKGTAGGEPCAIDGNVDLTVTGGTILSESGYAIQGYSVLKIKGGKISVGTSSEYAPVKVFGLTDKMISDIDLSCIKANPKAEWNAKRIDEGRSSDAVKRFLKKAKQKIYSSVV